MAPSTPKASGSERVEIVLVSGRRLLVGAEIDPTTLTRLVQVLERA